MFQKLLALAFCLIYIFCLSAEESISAPTDLKVQKASFTKATISWKPGAGSSDKTIYAIFRNKTEIATTPKTTYADSELKPETKYRYQVRAKNPDGKISNPSSKLVVKTLPVLEFDSFGLIQKLVDSFHESAIKPKMLLQNVTAKLSEIRGSTVAFTKIDSSIVRKMVEAEVEFNNAPEPELTPEQAKTALQEIQEVLKEFGGHSFLVFYTHSKLIELADQHMAEGKYEGAEILFEAALKLIHNVENITFTTLASMARMKLAQINSNSSKEEIIAAVTAAKVYYLRFFSYFPNSNSHWAIHAYACATFAHFKYFPVILTYNQYDNAFFESALSTVQFAKNISNEDYASMSQDRFTRVDAWQLIKMNVSFAKPDGRPASGQIIIKNVSDKLPFSVFYDELIPDKRVYKLTNGLAVIPVYKGHSYDITAVFDVEGGAPVKYYLPDVPHQKGQKAVFNQFNQPDAQDLPAGSNYCEMVFITDRPAMPYNLRAERKKNIFTLAWDWVKPDADYQLKHFKIFRGDSELYTVTEQKKGDIPIESESSIYTYTVRAYDINDKPSPESPSIEVSPSDIEARSIIKASTNKPPAPAENSIEDKPKN